MGNNTSTSASKPGRPHSPSSFDSSSASAGHRREPRHNLIPAHSTHRSAAPPEQSLAEAQGSTAGPTKPLSIPATAVSSLSPSPHSSLDAAASKAVPIPVEPRSFRDDSVRPKSLRDDHPASKPKSFRDELEPSKPVAVPIESSSVRAAAMYTDSRFADAHLVANNSLTDTFTRPPRLPLPIEEEVHTPGSPILGPEETETAADVPDVEGDSSDGLTRKSSIVSTATMEDDDSQELRVDRSRPTVPTMIEWKQGGDKVYVTGTIFQWNRKQRLHAV